MDEDILEEEKDVFIYFSHLRDDQPPKLEWKFWLSIDDETPGAMAIAWDAIKDILIEYELTTTKVLAQDYVLSQLDEIERGKQITLY